MPAASSARLDPPDRLALDLEEIGRALVDSAEVADHHAGLTELLDHGLGRRVRQDAWSCRQDFDAQALRGGEILVDADACSQVEAPERVARVVVMPAAAAAAIARRLACIKPLVGCRCPFDGLKMASPPPDSR